MTTSKLDVALYIALAVGIGEMISHIAPTTPDPQPTPADPPRAETSVLVTPPAASTPPPQPEATATPIETPKQDSSTVVAPALTWLDLLGDAKAQSQATGKPILVHFCYEGCLPCAEMDREVFTDPRVIEALDAFVLLRVDVLAPWGSIDQTCASAWSKAADEPLTQCPRESILQADGQFVAPKGKRFVKPPADADGYLKYLDSLTKKGR